MENINTVTTQDEAGTEAQLVEEKVKPYTFRRLNSTDLFPMIKIIGKIGIDELTEVFDGNTIKKIIDGVTKKEKNITDKETATDEEVAANEEKNTVGKEILVGIGVSLKLVNKIMEHIPSCENEIYTLLSRVSGMSVEEIKGLDLSIFLEMLLDFIMKDEFMDFFGVALKYIKRLG